MQSDLPHTLFRDKKKPSEARIDPEDMAFKLQEEANRRAAARHAKDDEYTLDEIFAGAAD